MISSPSAEIPDLEIISKDVPQAISSVQSVSCQRRPDEVSPESLRTRLLSPTFLILSWVCFSLGETYLNIIKE